VTTFIQIKRYKRSFSWMYTRLESNETKHALGNASPPSMTDQVTSSWKDSFYFCCQSLPNRARPPGALFYAHGSITHYICITACTYTHTQCLCVCNIHAHTCTHVSAAQSHLTDKFSPNTPFGTCMSQCPCWIHMAHDVTMFVINIPNTCCPIIRLLKLICHKAPLCMFVINISNT
jgi:hypothetical protein